MQDSSLDAHSNRNNKVCTFEIELDMSSVIECTNSSILTKQSQWYSPDCSRKSYYYEAFEIKVVENRYYKIWSNSSIDTFGFLYEHQFDPLNPEKDLLDKNDDGRSDLQFQFEIPLYNDTKYILVVTTYRPTDIGQIEIHMWGLKNVLFSRVCKLRDVVL